MNKQAIHVSVDNPCSANWKQMTDAGVGRFCNACEKVVVDFTSMSDEQLINFLAKQVKGEHPCGHFRKDQLNKTIELPKPPKAFKFFKLVASFFLAQALFYQGKAFGKINPLIEVVCHDEVPGDGKITITGRVLDYHSNMPINGLKVFIDSTGYYSITNKKGQFTIVIPKTMSGAITLLTEYVNSENYVAGSIILAKKADIDTLTRDEIILYRYPDETLDEMQIVEYKVPLISGGYTIGAPLTVTTLPKETFWHRITKVFRKK